MIQTAESVTFMHPDKICDQISDAILDECLRQDPYSRVAVETIGGHNTVVLVGEVTTKADVDFSDIARKLYKKITGKEIGVMCNIVKQAGEIAKGVDKGGAGDQGIMVGYACNENYMRIPQELFIARKLLEPYMVDGKSQVTLDNGKPTEIVLSVQGATQQQLQEDIGKFFTRRDMSMYSMPNVYCNNTGSFEVGGFDSDSGVTGRKIVVDQYGPRVPVGGGAFSGKDATKVDRSGAYMARWIALKLMKTYGADEVLVRLGYVIGKVEPIMATAIINKDYKEQLEFSYDCRPQAIIERFDLRKPIYLKTAMNGHFGIKNYPWEQV